MDFYFNPLTLSRESSLDAFVQLALNDEKPFGETEVRWKSKGAPEWDQCFRVDIAHPKSYLVVFVCDDDAVLRKESAFGYTRNCGFIEIPLWVLPRNRSVTGWFRLTHPDIVDAGAKLADRRATSAEAQQSSSKDAGASGGQDGSAEEPASAGRLRLKLLLETSLSSEIAGHMRPAPLFVQSLPSLDVPGFFQSVDEIKQLLLERLLLKPILCVQYAISWDNPALSSAVLCWHWLLCYRPQFIWASVWLLLLLCFWREVPKQVVEKEEDETEARGIIGGTADGIQELASETYAATTGVFMEPIKGAQQGSSQGDVVTRVAGGAVGFVKGAALGTAGLITHTAKGVTGLGKGVGGGLVGTLSSLRAPGLGEFQQLMHVMPGLRDVVRAVQRPARSAAGGLKSVDDVFYWKDAKLTTKVVAAVAALFLLSLTVGALSHYMGVVSGYAWLVLGSLVLVAQASFFNVVVKFIMAVVAVATKPKPSATFSRYDFFEAA